MYTGVTMDGKTVKGELEYHGLMACIRTVNESGYQITAIDPKTLREEEKEWLSHIKENPRNSN